MRTRFSPTSELLNDHARPLQPLTVGDLVYVQNQHGRHPKKWDKPGTVMELRNHGQYVVKVDGSGRLTLRNRRFLRKIAKMTTTIAQLPEDLHPTVLPDLHEPWQTSDMAPRLAPTVPSTEHQPPLLIDDP